MPVSTQQPSDVIRLVDDAEIPSTAREISALQDDLTDGLLMVHQKQWVTQCIKYPLNIAEKCRRSGITLATAWNDTITAASTKKAGGDNIYYIGDTKEKGLEFIGYCAHFARVMASGMAHNWKGIEVVLFDDQVLDERGKVISTRQITAYRIRFASGFQIVALSSNPANVRGLQGIVNIDEAAFHKDVQAVIDASLALIIWGGKVRIISTHNGNSNPFNQLIRDSLKGLYQFHVFRITFDEVVKNGLYKKVCLVKGKVWSQEAQDAWYKEVRGAYGANKAAMGEELDCIPKEGNGVAIPGILIENCMHEDRPVVRLELPDDFSLNSLAYRQSWCKGWLESNVKPLLDKLNPELEHVFGQDYARHGDFSVITPMSIEMNLVRRVPFVVEMQNVPIAQQRQILWYIIDRLPRFSKGAMDATGNGEAIAEDTADHVGHSKIAQVKLNDAWYRPNMVGFQGAFEDQMIDLPRNATIKNDIRALQLINGVIKLPKLRQRDIENSEFMRHGDSAIALALAWWASQHPAAPIEFTGAPSKSSRWDLPANEDDYDDNEIYDEGAGGW